MRELVGSVDAKLIDIRGDGFAYLLHPQDYGAPHAFARQVIADGADGIVYPSVRHAGGTCLAAFYPDVVPIPVQGRHLTYHWDGERIDKVRIHGSKPEIWAIDP